MSDNFCGRLSFYEFPPLKRGVRLTPRFSGGNFPQKLSEYQNKNMAYSQFSYKKVRNELGIENTRTILFEKIKRIQPSDWLEKTLIYAEDIALFSEKSRSEGIVFPILVELKQLNQDILSIYSGAIINADEAHGLNGECDFIFSSGKQDFEIRTPLFCMIEAEDNDIEKNIPQCTAQMEGARIYNQNEGKNIQIIYGCVTTGTEWQFLKLENKTCWIDRNRYYINDLGSLLGVLQAIVDFYIPQIKT